MSRPLFILFFIITPLSAFAGDRLDDGSESPANSWHLLVGGGSSQPGWGNTNEKVKTTDVILQQNRPQKMARGKNWYLNRKSVLVEVPFTYLREPDEPGMIGVTMNVNWAFIANQHVQPFILIGGGPVYTKAEIPGTSSRLKGSYQVGTGLDFSLGKLGMSFEWRYHHLSNGGFKEPNDSLNSSKFLLGFKLPF